MSNDFNVLFRRGITPVEGPRKGEKFEVDSIQKDGIRAVDKDGHFVNFKYGEYELWTAPKTLFQKGFEPTWGNLKKACEEADVPDDTPLVLLTDFNIFPLGFSRRDAEVKYTDGKLYFL